MRIPFSIELYLDKFSWLPHIFFIKYKEQFQVYYYGHKWALLIFLWGIEIEILGSK